ncbi:MAG: GDP-mannose 4,6-dehydratase, partial [Deltaproteobacteria bacterium]|nr:GDP-mannose 4,6-dehydratase [Deltaproteobacteria bacterium]
FREIGVEIEWRGNGVDEVGVVKGMFEVGGWRSEAESVKSNLGEERGQSQRTSQIREGDVVVEVDPRYFRPTEVDELLGDPTKANKELGWEPRISFKEMVAQMVRADLEEASRDQLCKESGFSIPNFRE